LTGWFKTNSEKTGAVPKLLFWGTSAPCSADLVLDWESFYADRFSLRRFLYSFWLKTGSYKKGGGF
jgi:hypothetical protein